MPNRLSNEASAYLRKHQNNPVDWWPWCNEAFSKAKAEDKPLFISIGYFSCHWCSVMERESFEDSETADFLNKNFVSIKVDREEMPDVDKVYQRYYNTLTGESGGWPLSIYAFPDGLPFYITTYLPKSFSLRSRTFMSLNKEIVESWNNERDDLFEISLGLSRNLDSSNKIMVNSKKPLSPSDIIGELQNLQERMDWTNGGFDSDPKFPRFSSLRLLLKEGSRRNVETLINFVKLTVQKMSQGGIYDQLNGGICRYSVDKSWTVPHFEKMLYDQAGWLHTLVDLYSVTNEAYYKYLIDDTLQFLQKWMFNEEKGGFYSSVDAESDGAEGKYYAFTHDEVKSVLDPNYIGFHFNLGPFRIGVGTPDQMLNLDYKIAKLRFGIRRMGNFRDPHRQIIAGNLLQIKMTIAEIGNKLGKNPELIAQRLSIIKRKLLVIQKNRSKPAVDKKIITAWNSLMISALFKVYEKTGNQKAMTMAKSSLEYIISHHISDNHLIRFSHPEFNGNAIGILDDYVFFIGTLILAFEVIDDFSYIDLAASLNKTMKDEFYDMQSQVYYLNNADAETTTGRILLAMDDSFQSALNTQIENLFKLGHYLEDPSLTQMGQDIVMRLTQPSKEYKGAMSSFFMSSGYYLNYPVEVVVINGAESEFDEVILSKYLPERLIYRWPRTDDAPKWEVLEGRTVQPQPSVFVCKGATCTMPLLTVIDVQRTLSQWAN